MDNLPYDPEAAWQIALAQMIPQAKPVNPNEELKMKLAFADGVTVGIKLARQIYRELT